MADRIRSLLSGVSGKTILNYGSSSADFYQRVQPYIWTDLLLPLVVCNTVINLDIKNEPGVHVVCRANEPVPLGSRAFDIVLACSLLEHVASPSVVISEIYRVLKRPGVLIADVPADYPYHPDPIDTMLRIQTQQQWEELLGELFQVQFFARIGRATLVKALVQ